MGTGSDIYRGIGSVKASGEASGIHNETGSSNRKHLLSMYSNRNKLYMFWWAAMDNIISFGEIFSTPILQNQSMEKRTNRRIHWSIDKQDCILTRTSNRFLTFIIHYLCTTITYLLYFFLGGTANNKTLTIEWNFFWGAPWQTKDIDCSIIQTQTSRN